MSFSLHFNVISKSNVACSCKNKLVNITLDNATFSNYSAMSLVQKSGVENRSNLIRIFDDNFQVAFLLKSGTAGFGDPAIGLITPTA